MNRDGKTTECTQLAAAFLPAHLVDVMPAQLCEKLARRHYENFTVGSIFLPAELRKHVYNVYAYCRVCDDLGDETGDAELSLRLLDWWRQELCDTYKGEPHHPIFKALKETIDQFDLPMQPFEDLISAFVQDQRVSRYDTYEQLLDYCKRSANPVGRIFLMLMGYRDEARQELSDCTCTALQLAKFWQDIAVDYLKDRIYIPLEDLQRFGYNEAELRNHLVNASFTALMRFEVARARELFERGKALHELVKGPGAADVELFSNGGLALLDSIEREGYDIFRKHITVSKSKKIALMLGWGLRHLKK